VRDEIEHLLDDNEDMAQLYLTRKWMQNQQPESLLGIGGSNVVTSTGPPLRRMSSNRSGSLVTSNYLDDNDVEDLEMLLEAYFMQLDGTRNKILSVSIGPFELFRSLACEFYFPSMSVWHLVRPCSFCTQHACHVSFLGVELLVDLIGKLAAMSY